ncbi:MAG: hypothetical protein OHK0015_43420 [Chloroflexi bacterium OHK40]
MRPDLSQVLDEALARLRAGASIEECLRAYPEHAADLEPMLRTAAAIQRQARASLPPSLEQWLSSGRQEIEAYARASYGRRKGLSGHLGAFLRRIFGGGAPRLASAALSAVIIFFMTFYTVDATAARSIPGDYLYAWKLISEQTRISLARNPDRRAELVASSVERRVEEIAVLAQRGQLSSGAMMDTVERLNAQVRDVLRTLPDTSPTVRDRTVDRLDRLLIRAEDNLRSAAPAGAPTSTIVQSAAAEVADLREVLPTVEPDPASIVPVINATPEPVGLAETPTATAKPVAASTAPAAGGVATPISAPNSALEEAPPAPATGDETATPSPTLTRTPTPERTTAAPSSTPQPTQAVAPPTRTPLARPRPTSTALPSATSLPVIDAPTAGPTSTPTVIVEPSSTALPTATRTPVATSTPAPTSTPTATSTPEPTHTPRPTATSTPEPTVTDTPEPTATSTPEPTVTDTPEPTATSTPEPTHTPRPTATSTPEPTAASTPEPTATSELTNVVRPILECVARLDDGSYVAYFGFRNTASVPVVIEVGEQNNFSPEPANRGQPTTFPVGRSSYYPNAAFSVSFDGSRLVWSLNGSTATASRNSQSCGG